MNTPHCDPQSPEPGGVGVLAGTLRPQDLVEQVQTGLFVVQDDHIAYANPMLAEMVGWPAAELIGQRHEVMAAPEFREHSRIVVQRRLAGKEGRPGEIECLRRDNSRFDARVFARRIEFGSRPAVLVTLFDISELKGALRRAEWNSAMLARTEALCRSGSFEVDWPSGRLVLSAGLRLLIGLAPDAGVDMNIDALEWVPADERAFVAGIWRNAVPDEAFDFQHRLQCADGRRLVVAHRGVLGVGANRGVAILQDVTAQCEAELRVQELSCHDEVTGLPNRSWLLDQVDAAIYAARWDPRVITLLTLHIPRIDRIKASMGFGAGDTLAMALAARLREACADTEIVAQLGDSEFVLMLESAPDSAHATIRQRAEMLLRLLEAPIRLGVTDVFPQCVIGIASFPADAQRPDGLLEAAQAARLDVAGASGIASFRHETTTRALREMQVEAALRRAIERDELTLVYQPQVDFASGAVRGAEALLRWNSAELGQVGPAEFIPVAERAGLIGSIGDWVIRAACEQSAAWCSRGLPPVRISINLTPAQLQRPDLVRHVEGILTACGADPSCLGIELTESMVADDIERTIAVLRGFKALGVEISLDDFGTGFSSLNNLARLPIDVVKIDRSFMHDVTAAIQQVSVTRAIINMAHGLQMKVMAEGVETEGQLSLLGSHGCDLFQGYWFSKPLPPSELEALLREGKCLPERFVTRLRRNRTLLLVDDEENIVAALKRLFRRDGYHIVTANSAAEGLQRLAEHDVDVIVSDQRMPGMTGVEFLHRAKDLYPQTVRMVLSGYTELQSIIDAVNEGAIYKFLTKPWDDERLRGHVAEAFRQKELADENRRLAGQVASANADLATLNERLERLLMQQRDQTDLLADSAARMRDMLDELPAAVLGIDPDGVLAYVNREAEQSVPTLSALLGCSIAEALPAAALLAASNRTRAPLELEFEGQSFQLLSRSFGASAPRGKLLILLPQPTQESV